jgi:hypothetical protein
MKIPDIEFSIESAIINLAEDMNDDMRTEALSMSLVEFVLPDGRRVQAQLTLQSDEFEFIREE